MSNQEKIRLSDVLDLLSEVSQCFTREDDLPDGLLPRIDAALAAANAVNTSTIDPRWADIDFDRTDAEMRDMRAQIERLQAHIDRTQPISTNSEGYVESTKNADAKTLLESAAALCDAEVDLRMKAAWQHADGSANRDRCYAAARAAGACASSIREMKDAFITQPETTNG